MVKCLPCKICDFLYIIRAGCHSAARPYRINVCIWESAERKFIVFSAESALGHDWGITFSPIKKQPFFVLQNAAFAADSRRLNKYVKAI